MDTPIRNAAFAKSLAITYSEYFDGVSPKRNRASLRVTEEGSLEITNVETRKAVHWNLQRIRQVPDQADVGAAVFAPDNEGAARLIIREAEALRVLLETDAPLRLLGGRRRQVFGVAFMGALAAACFAGLLFFLIPHFAVRAAERMPVETEIAMGEALIQSLPSGYGVCSTPEGDAALERMVARLEDNADLYIPLQVRVVRSDAVNAYASLGGQITLFSGLIDEADTPEQVAGVVAHEIGHVANRDVVREVFRATGSLGLIGLLFGDLLGTTAVSSLATTMVSASYSRTAEIAADRYAHELMIEADLPPEALADFFEQMLASRGDVARATPELLRSHPDMADRLLAAQAAGSGGEVRPLLSDAEWRDLRNICDGRAASSGDKS